MLGSLIPWSAFIAAIPIANVWVHSKHVSVRGLIGASPIYLPVVALPSFLALVAARRTVAWVAVLVVMTVVAAFAGVSVITTDDAQAGLAVLFVPVVAVPLAALLWIGQAVVAVMARR